MKVGDYVRTKHYGISKITDIYNEDKIELDNVNAFGIKGVCYMAENIIKSSPNIIDLIEVGDYVNGLKVEGVNNEIKGFGTIIFSKDSSIMEDYIYSIVTKEQFESMEYKIGE
jgi:hypothetical protein